MRECLTCGGQYEPMQADGMAYFHVCGPLSRVELAARIDAGKIAYPAGTTAADYRAKAVAAGFLATQGSALAADDLMQRATYERANKRDETVPSTADRDSGTIKAAGAGFRELATAPARVVVVP